MKRFRAAEHAAGELTMRREVMLDDDADHDLLSAWDGKALVIRDADHAREVGSQATQLACDLDVSLWRRVVQDPVERSAIRHVCNGLWGLAGRLRLYVDEGGDGDENPHQNALTDSERNEGARL